MRATKVEANQQNQTNLFSFFKGNEPVNVVGQTRYELRHAEYSWETYEKCYYITGRKNIIEFEVFFCFKIQAIWVHYACAIK